ncbi:MAG: NAD(P)-binding protein [Vicinamibacterales bacterium]
MIDTAKPPRRRVAVLGGGAGSMAALWALTSLPNASERFDITVYQMGWRLGGKGASGRNAAFGDRIEEHGLHVWAGFYRNAFRMMREIYAAQPDDGRLFKQWSDAFKRHSQVMLEEHVDGKWIQWALDLAEDPADSPDSDPTTGGDLPPPGEYLRLLIDMLLHLIHQSEVSLAAPTASHVAYPGWFGRIKADVETGLGDLERVLTDAGVLVEDAVAVIAGHPPERLWHAAREVARLLPDDPRLHSDAHLAVLSHLVKSADESSRAALTTGVRQTDDERRLDQMSSLVRATIVGMIEDDVMLKGFEAINDEEWTKWMGRHGATPAAQGSAMVRGIYDYVFGYEKGDGSRPSLEAGTALHGILRLFFTFKGSLFWEMQAGMGDVVFAPTYEVLKNRGVKFEFFHRIEQLTPDPTRTLVDTIVVRRQATVKGDRPYEPLRLIAGVPSWPSQPDLDQLVNGPSLAEAQFESAWAPPTGELRTLERGQDFDDVIMGISIDGVKNVCRDLPAAGSPFQLMLQQLQTVQTCSMQLWFTPDAAGLGAPVPARIVSAYADNLNTWSDMSFLLPRETWPAPGPRFIAYFCGQFPDAAVIPPYDDHAFPSREMARLRDQAVTWLNTNAAGIWPLFDWSKLHDASNANGSSRLASQYLRVNIDPSERYVLSLPGTSKYRLRAGESGFKNLFFTGDWVHTSINAGCVEAAVMAGMAAAAALSGDPIAIDGGLK